MMQHTRYAPTGIFLGGFLLLALFHASACWAGNNEMVQKNVVELDAVNKEALGQIKDIPAQGKVKLKAHVSGTKGKHAIKIIEKKIVSQPVEPQKNTPAPAGIATPKAITTASVQINSPASGIIEENIDFKPDSSKKNDSAGEIIEKNIDFKPEKIPLGAATK